ncbi:phage tail protein [Aquabacter spiritensis]|uniref:Microcystin-dependent protein n=1 Tax=Aquabacter spiritensis TaxID=933073 RepID=A0A4R3M5A0_9HYPH|nr:tail fiber protein [Aquabacter spiritensis]TCT08056.1 microcystin-dependent protein [Aquabacter spiritensis]
MEEDWYLGELRIFPYADDWVPAGWLPCEGQMLGIMSYAALYSLIGTTYGGDGRSTFRLPDLRGRTPLGLGQYFGPDGPGDGYVLGQSGGVEKVRLDVGDMPAHTHAVRAVRSSGTSTNPSSAFFAMPKQSSGTTKPLYQTAATDLVSLAPGVVSASGHADSADPQGRAAPHSNVQPFLVLGYFIATTGYYPEA